MQKAQLQPLSTMAVSWDDFKQPMIIATEKHTSVNSTKAAQILRNIGKSRSSS
jgi:hypothetical protein